MVGVPVAAAAATEQGRSVEREGLGLATNTGVGGRWPRLAGLLSMSMDEPSTECAGTAARPRSRNTPGSSTMGRLSISIDALQMASLSTTTQLLGRREDWGGSAGSSVPCARRHS